MMNILIVDDEKDCLDDIITALEPTGYQCLSTTNPLKAIEVYKENKIDVVISDIRMLEMDGIELLKTIKNMDRNARVIIITAYGDLETAKKAINNRACFFFGKPVDFDELIVSLRSIEKEIEIDKDRNLDYTNLKSEHEKLQDAYDELLNFVRVIKK